MTNKQTTKLSSEIIADFLLGKGVTHVFDLSGGMITYLEDAISRRSGIECIPMHHEQGAGFAAEGYARNGRTFGVAIATSGPGATNLITPIGSCYFDSVPAMFITGQVHTDNIKKNAHIRQEGFQETDIVAIVTPITKYAVLVKDPSRILYELEKSHFIMTSGRMGPVVLDIPINIQRTEVDVRMLKHFYGSREHLKMQKSYALFTRPIDQKKIDKLQQLLQSARAPLVVIGNGIRLSGTQKKLERFVSRNKLPVVSSLLGLDSFDSHHENFVGYIGSNGNREANIVFANADLVIALGTRLDIRQIGDPKFLKKGMHFVHVDIDKHVIGYSVKSKLSFETDLNTFFDTVNTLSTAKKGAWWKFIALSKDAFSREHVYTKNVVDPNTFIRDLSAAAPLNTVVAVDVGQNQMWSAQSWKTKPGQRLLFSGGMGAMGFSLPVAIGAWYPEKQNNLFVITGDGGLQINIQELETVARNKIPLKLFVLNNKSLGMVREFQDLYFKGNHQSTVEGYGCPDLKKIAFAYGLSYVNVKSIREEDPVFKEIIASTMPVLIEVNISPTAALTPRVVYGHALDDQAPYLDDKQKAYLKEMIDTLYA